MSKTIKINVYEKNRKKKQKTKKFKLKQYILISTPLAY